MHTKFCSKTCIISTKGSHHALQKMSGFTLENTLLQKYPELDTTYMIDNVVLHTSLFIFKGLSQQIKNCPGIVATVLLVSNSARRIQKNYN
jgi:hypothetical protein